MRTSQTKLVEEIDKESEELSQRKASKRSRRKTALSSLTPADIVRVKADPFESNAAKILKNRKKKSEEKSSDSTLSGSKVSPTDPDSLYDRISSRLMHLSYQSKLLAKAIDHAISSELVSGPESQFEELMFKAAMTNLNIDVANCKAQNSEVELKSDKGKYISHKHKAKYSTEVSKQEDQFTGLPPSAYIKDIKDGKHYSRLKNEHSLKDSERNGHNKADIYHLKISPQRETVLQNEEHTAALRELCDKFVQCASPGGELPDALLAANTNNNHPGSVDGDASTDQAEANVPTLSAVSAVVVQKAKSDGFFGYDVNVQDLPTTRSSVDERMSKVRVLVPIGSLVWSPGPAKTIVKWTDITSVMIHGTPSHRNLNPFKVGRFTIPSTLKEGGLTSEMVKSKLYAVKYLKRDWISMAELLRINAKSRLFTETHAKFVCINLLLALRFLHENGIFHGSIQPAKVVINDRGYPFLTGFRTADIIDDRQSRPREKLPLEYSSPDHLYQEYLTEATDIFAVGILTFSMVYGRSPHKGATYADTRRNILDRRFVPRFGPETISETGRKFIMKCIRKDERRRYTILHNRQGLFDSSQWFSGLSEDKLYKQSVSSPLLSVLKKVHTKSE